MSITEDYLVFRLDNDTLGIPVRQVREILGADRVSDRIDNASSVLGFIEHRGERIPAIGLRKRLEYEVNASTEYGAFIVVDTASAGSYRYIAVGVDDVSDVVSVGLRNQSDLPGFGKDEDNSPCRRIIDVGETLVVSVDATKILGLDEVRILETIGLSMKVD